MKAEIVSADSNLLKQRVAEWIKWLLEQERSNNPGTDLTGQRSARNQNNPDVWFLAGTFGNRGTVHRKCTVPADRPILVVAVSSDMSFAEDPRANRVQDLSKRANDIAKLHDVVEVTIDGVTYKKGDSNLQMVETDPVDITFPEDNVYKDRYLVEGGVTKLVCVAWAMLIKLSEGEYKVRLRGHHPESVGHPEFLMDVEYDLTIQKG